MALSLREARCKFSRAISELVLYAYEIGFEAAFDEVMERLTERDPSSDHMKNSLHHVGLAADVLLYKDGQYLGLTEQYVQLGEWWEAKGKAENLPLAWGGRFSDGNHFSLAWGDRR